MGIVDFIKEKVMNTMKKSYWIAIFVILGLAILFICWQKYEVPKNNIYELNREWIFSVKMSNISRVDTIILKIVEKPEIMQGKKAMWSFMDANSLLFKNTTDTSITEYTDMYDVDKSYVSLPSPTIQYFRLTKGVPSPNIRFPIYKGYSMNVKTTFKKVKDQDQFENQTVTGKLEVVDKIYYDNPVVKDWCWVIDAVGNSSIGTFKAKYYFNEKYGYVYFNYDFNTYNIIMEPISIK